MKASELRKGNLLLGSEDQVVIVECINRDGSVGIVGNASRFGVESDVPCLIPIPLTEEWLDRTVFEKAHTTGLYGFSANGFRYCIDLNNKSINFDYSEYVGLFANIEFVHQIQNLYFALTGEELEFK